MAAVHAGSGAQSKDLRARLGATTLVLKKLAGKPGFANASSIQAKAFASTAKSVVGLSEADRSDLLQMAAETGFAPEDFELCSSSLMSASPQEPATKKPRRSMQNFEAFVNYFTEEEWTIMKNATADEVRHIIFQKIAVLGGRCPEETTKQLVACLIIALTSDMGKPISHASKITEYETVKSAWLKFVRKFGAPKAHLEQLPASPAGFKSQQPEMFRQAFPGECSPVPCQVNVTLVRALQCSFGTRSRVSSSSVPMLNLREPAPMDSMAMFARHMMEHAERQNQMLSMLLQGPGHGHVVQRGPRCGGELQNAMLQRGGSSRLLELPDEAVQRRRPQENVQRSRPQAMALMDQPSEAEEANGGEVEELEEATEEEAKEVASSSVSGAADLLGLLEERDAAKKLEAKIAKARAAAEAKAAKEAKTAAEANAAAAAAVETATPTKQDGTAATPKAGPKKKCKPAAEVEVAAVQAATPKAVPKLKGKPAAAPKENGTPKKSKPAILPTKAVPKLSLATPKDKPSPSKPSPLKKGKPAAAIPKGKTSPKGKPATAALPSGVSCNTEWSRDQVLVRIGAHLS